MSAVAGTGSDAANSTTGERRPANIAVVDDDSGFAGYLRTFLALRGYEARSYTRGDEIVAAIRQGEPPDIVLLDVAMPGMDGLELARVISMPVESYVATGPTVSEEQMKTIDLLSEIIIPQDEHSPGASAARVCEAHVAKANLARGKAGRRTTAGGQRAHGGHRRLEAQNRGDWSRGAIHRPVQAAGRHHVGQHRQGLSPRGPEQRGEGCRHDGPQPRPNECRRQRRPGLGNGDVDHDVGDLHGGRVATRGCQTDAVGR